MSIANWLHSLVDRLFGTGQGSSKIPFADLSNASTQGGVFPQSSPKTTTLAEAVTAYKRASGNSVLEQRFSDEILERAQRFDDLLWVTEVIPESAFRRLLVEKLAAATTSFGQHMEVYRLSEQPATQSAALEKMAALATSINEKLTVYAFAGADSQIGQTVFRELTSETRSREEWVELFENADADGPLERFAAEKAVETADTLKALVELSYNDRISETFGFEAAILAKLRGISASFDEWQDIVDNYSGAIEVLAIEKMIETATTIDELLTAGEYVDEDNGTEEKLVLKAESSSNWTEEFCRKILDEQDDDHVLFNIALKKLLQMTTTAVQCLQVYYEWDFSDEDNEMVLNRLGELATANERAIIALVSEEGSQIEEWAQTNA